MPFLLQAPIVLFLSVSLLSLISCSELDSTSNSTSGQLKSVSSRKLEDRLIAIQEVAATRGLYNILPIAGVANAETGLAHCWSEAQWACQGPASSSCGWGPVIAGAGDGRCANQQGGLGMFQLDGGTYQQTLQREGNRVLTIEGNIEAGLTFIYQMLKQRLNISTNAEVSNWLNGITVGSSRYYQWIHIVVETYNGCRQRYCSIYESRFNHYDQKTKAIKARVDQLPMLSQSWIGSPCSMDNDCDFSANGERAQCISGLCTVPCEGLCPDRTGYASTFCISGEHFNNTGGLCVARSGNQNNQCRSLNAQEISTNRYVGSSNAMVRDEIVCVPLNSSPYTSSQSTTPSQSNTPNQSNPNETEIANVCLSNVRSSGGESCLNEEVWRCACHTEYALPVSQVCRDGSWINFVLSPQDCSRCNGDDRSGCGESPN